MIKRYFLSISALVLAALIAGCSIMPYEDPEEQRKQEKQAEQQNSEVAVVAQELLDTDLTVDEKLTGVSGQSLAIYSARLPQFTVKDGKKSQSFQRINEYYQEQLVGYKEDCHSFFTMVRQHYGVNWTSATVKELLYSTEMTYSLTDAPENYICILRTYKVRDGKSKAQNYRSGEVFLLDSGWRLTLEELFGSHYKEAEPLLKKGIADWCVQHGMTKDAAAKLKPEDYMQGFGMDEDSLLFFLPPFTMSSTDDQARTISLPLSDFSGLLPENIKLPAEQPADDSPTHSA